MPFYGFSIAAISSSPLFFAKSCAVSPLFVFSDLLAPASRRIFIKVFAVSKELSSSLFALQIVQWSGEEPLPITMLGKLFVMKLTVSVIFALLSGELIVVARDMRTGNSPTEMFFGSARNQRYDDENFTLDDL